ncbi:MAG TPA: hypothetical protein VMV45_05185 [Casimicrobiaceae bacterium]|nr:hypothetical protein [Casimicrobiaceae bacterium]
MKTKLKLAALAILLGTTTIAAAQTSTRAQAFADQLKQMQALSAQSDTYVFHPAPVLHRNGDDPVARQSFGNRFADLQAESSNSAEWTPGQEPTLTAAANDPARGESFASKFAQMQAASSNSGEWAFHPGANVPGSETNNTLVAGKTTGKTGLGRMNLTWK